MSKSSADFPTVLNPPRRRLDCCEGKLILPLKLTHFVVSLGKHTTGYSYSRSQHTTGLRWHSKKRGKTVISTHARSNNKHPIPVNNLNKKMLSFKINRQFSHQFFVGDWFELFAKRMEADTLSCQATKFIQKRWEFWEANHSFSFSSYDRISLLRPTINLTYSYTHASFTTHKWVYEYCGGMMTYPLGYVKV